MNKQSAALLSILSECDPQDAVLAHESRIQRIVHMDEYAELRHRDAFSNQFEQFYSLEHLEQYSDSQLDKLASALPVTPHCLENILFSLKNGDAPTLTPEDAPDFFDQEKLSRLSQMLESDTHENYTNIQPGEFMAIFDPATVKSVNDYYSELPLHVSDYGKELAHILGSTKYCISRDEINNMDAVYQSQIKALQDEIEAGGKRARRRRLFKLFLGITALFIPSFIGRLTGCLSPSAITMCTLIDLVLVLIYWIVG